MRGEIRCECPSDRVRGCVDTHCELEYVGDDHDPVVLVPEDFRVTEVDIARDPEDRVAGILNEALPVIVAVCQALSLFSGLSDGVECDDAVGLIGEKTGCVVHIYHSAAAEDERGGVVGRKSNGLVGPVIQVLRSGMAPVLGASDGVQRVVLVVEVVGAGGIKVHPVWVVDEATGSREVQLGTPFAVVGACEGGASKRGGC